MIPSHRLCGNPAPVGVWSLSLVLWSLAWWLPAAEAPKQVSGPSKQGGGTSMATGADVVYLTDGTQQTGQVVELGGNRIDLLMAGGTKRIFKKDIQKVHFDETRRQELVEDTDVVIRQGGHKIRGSIELLQGGKVVRVALPGGSTAEIPRSEVLRIIRRGETLATETTVYTRELAIEIDKAIAAVFLGGGGPVESTQGSSATPPGGSAGALTATEAEGFLGRCGILAIEKVQAALRTADPGSEGAKALSRVDRLYRLKQVVATEIEETDAGIYPVLTGGDVHRKCDLLLLIFPRFVEESVPLAAFLATDALQDPVVRAWSVDFLQRMHRNKELLEVYRRSTGQDQLASAIALGKNRILLGVPALLDAMDMELPDVRAVAEKHLREFSGKDFGYRADAAPQARRDALARWRSWWQENEKAITRLAENILRDVGEEPTEERTQAVQLWKDATKDLDSKKYEAAEAKLRRARDIDPNFYQASVSLGIVLYSYLNRACDAVKILEDAKAKPTSESRSAEREWIYLHLGNSLQLCGRAEEALDAYEQCKAVNPDNLYAVLGVGDASFLLATADNASKPDERKKLLDAALAAYKAAMEIAGKRLEGLTMMQPDAVLAQPEFSFDRRGYNRSVLGLRVQYRLQKQELVLKAARVQALVGQDREAVKALRGAIDELAVDTVEKTKHLEVPMRTLLAFFYEKLDRPLLAFREYQTVLERLDPKNAESLQGVERLRSLAREPRSAKTPKEGRESGEPKVSKDR